MNSFIQATEEERKQVEDLCKKHLNTGFEIKKLGLLEGTSEYDPIGGNLEMSASAWTLTLQIHGMEETIIFDSNWVNFQDLLTETLLQEWDSKVPAKYRTNSK